MNFKRDDMRTELNGLYSRFAFHLFSSADVLSSSVDSMFLLCIWQSSPEFNKLLNLIPKYLWGINCLVSYVGKNVKIDFQKVNYKAGES